MKKAILFFSLTCSLPLLSQTESGRILLGGSVGYTADKTDRLDTAGTRTNTNKLNTLNVTIRGGYFFADNLAAGLLIGVNNQLTTNETLGTPPTKNVRKDMDNSMSFGLFGRYYTTPVDRKLSFFGQADFTYSTGKVTHELTYVNASGVTTSTKPYDKTGGLGLMISPGVAFFLSDMVALEATFGALGFVSNNTKSYNASDHLMYQSKSNRIEATFSPSTLRLGISFYLGGNGGANSGGGKR